MKTYSRSDNAEGIVGKGLYGAKFTGGAAPILLTPSGTSGAPNDPSMAHAMGELYVDKDGVLYFCIGGGQPGTWKKGPTCMIHSDMANSEVGHHIEVIL